MIENIYKVLMEFWLFLLVALAFTTVIVLMTKPEPKVDKSQEENKELLKELLEGFGLDLPAELKEAQPSVVKSIKTP